MGRRGCASAMGMIKFPSSCSSPKALCNQFIDYYICSRGVFCINHIKLRNFVVITIECSIATVDRGSIMTRIYRWSMMVYSSLQAEFMVTKYDGHIHRYGARCYNCSWYYSSFPPCRTLQCSLYVKRSCDWAHCWQNHLLSIHRTPPQLANPIRYRRIIDRTMGGESYWYIKARINIYHLKIT